MVIKSAEHMCLYLAYIVHLIESQLSSASFLWAIQMVLISQYHWVSLLTVWAFPLRCKATFFFSALMMTERGSLFKRFWRGKLRSNARLDYLSRLSPRARKDNTDDVGLLLSDVAEFIF